MRNRFGSNQIAVAALLPVILGGWLFFRGVPGKANGTAPGSVARIPGENENAAVQTPLSKDSKIIYLQGAHDLIITQKDISGGTKPCITLVNCYKITISKNKLQHSADVGIRLYNCRNIHIYDNYFTNLSTGVYAERSTGGELKIDHNQFLNMQGPYPRGQFVQFNNINGPGNTISYNRCENVPGKSNPEDAISLYKSNGTEQSPIIIKENWIRGGGPSHSGGGIMLGDNGGSYQIAADNKLVDPGQYGIAISGGDHNSITGNHIYARAQRFTNVGIYVAAYSGGSCAYCIVAHNKVMYFNSRQIPNACWVGPNTSTPSGWETNEWHSAISSQLLPLKIVTTR